MLHVISLSHSKLLETAPFDRLHIRVPSYIVTMAIFCIISEIKRNIGKKSRFRTLRHIRRLAPLGGSTSEYRHNVCYESKNLAIANRSRVSCAHNMPRASMITP